jgi:hypothetical protein
MTRNIFLAMFAILTYTTAMMIEPEQQGYSQHDRDALAKLTEQSVAEKRQHKILSGSDERAALRYLWGDGK